MWQTHPIFGAGLGAFIEENSFVTHNALLWVLAEMGLIGLLLILPLPLLIIYHIFKNGFKNLSDERIILLACMLVFGGFAMVHDIVYQRIIWYVLGMLMCYKAANQKPASFR